MWFLLGRAAIDRFPKSPAYCGSQNEANVAFGSKVSFLSCRLFLSQPVNLNSADAFRCCAGPVGAQFPDTNRKRL